MMKCSQKILSMSTNSKYIYLLNRYKNSNSVSEEIHVYDLKTCNFIKSFEAGFKKITAVPVLDDDVLIVSNNSLGIINNKITSEFLELFSQSFENITDEKAFSNLV